MSADHQGKLVTRLLTTLKNLAADESGVTAIEYGLFTAAFAVGLMITFSTFGHALSDVFDVASLRMNTASGRSVAVITPLDPV